MMWKAYQWMKFNELNPNYQVIFLTPTRCRQTQSKTTAGSIFLDVVKAEVKNEEGTYVDTQCDIDAQQYFQNVSHE